MTPEEQARANIDRLLRQTGWDVQDVAAVNLYASRGVAVREFSLKPGHGEADYLLFVDGHAVGVVDESKVHGSGQRTLADIVSVVRYAIGGADELAPFADGVRERFQGWMAMQETAGRSFTEEQIRWLEAIRDHIAGSVSMEMGDFQLPRSRSMAASGGRTSSLGKSWPGC